MPPKQAYIEHFRDLQNMPTALGSAELAQLDPMLLIHSYFSAKVEDLALLRGLRELCERGMQEGWNERTFQRFAREWMRETTDADGNPYNGEEERKSWSEEERQTYERDVRHIDSLARLKLIFRTQMAIASEYTAWLHGMSEQQRYEYPAWEFFRQPGAITKRPDHVEHEGDIMLKTDYEYWLERNSTDFGGFGVPWPPFGYNSWMHVAPVDRATCESLGLIHRNDPVQPLPTGADGTPLWGLPAKDLSTQLGTKSIKSLTEVERNELAEWCRQQGVSVTLPDAKGKVQITPQPPASPNGQAPSTPTPTATPAPVQPRPDGLAPGKPATIDEAIQGAGLDLNADATEAQMQKFLDSLHDRYPANRDRMDALLPSIRSTLRTSAQRRAAEKEVRENLQELAAMAHPSTLDKLPNINVLHRATTRGSLGSYDPQNHQITYRLGAGKETHFHELIHALHLHGESQHIDNLRHYFQNRTQGLRVQGLVGYNCTGKSDHWAPSFHVSDDYAGRIYNFTFTIKNKDGSTLSLEDTSSNPLGTDMPTRHLQKIALDSSSFVRYWNDRRGGKYLWRECFMECLKIFFN